MTEIQLALSRLVGLDLVGLGRAGSLEHFTFGKHPLRQDQSESLADFALHVSCTWRLIQSGALVSGQADFDRPSSPFVSDDDYDAGKVGSRLVDLRNSAMREYIAQTIVTVQSIKIDPGRAFSLQMSDAVTLEVFPAASKADHDDLEFWRLFQPRLDTPHFVVSSEGISRIGEV